MFQDLTTGSWSIVSGPVVLDAYIASEDILSMNQGAALDEDRGYVEFTVTPVNGTSVATAKVTAPVGATGSEQAHYTFEWDNSEAGDGVYIFQAVAVSGFGSRAEGMPVSIALMYENHAPPAPTNLEVDAVGDQTVQLGWVRPAAADVQHYQVWRSADGVNFSKIADNVPSEGYTDASGLVNGDTYYYKVRAVDSEGFAGASSNVVTATPLIPGDTTAPTVPSPLTAVADTGAATVHLTWAAASDPESGLSGYTIERSPDSVTWAVIQSGYDDVFYDDTAAGWSTTWYYRVKAVNNVAGESAYATAGPVTTIPEIFRSITVTNNSSADVYVWLENAVLGEWFAIDGTSYTTRPASGERVRKNNKSVTWSNLHSGIYNVYIHSGSSSGSTLLKTQAVTATAGDGTASYP
jgi:hypothetical protein